jgi:hypothetical protein
VAQPLFFLPDLREEAAKDVGLRRQVLKERGLSEVFADVPMVEQPLWELPGRGPENRPGCLMYFQTPTGGIPRRAEYRPSEQSWTPVGDGSLLWIGVDTAELPKPEELARKRQYDGYSVTLADGNQWNVPIIRAPDGQTSLPRDLIWDATGRLIEPIKPLYQAYWDETAETAKWVFDGVQPDYERALQLAIRALAINYRYDRNLHNVLRVIDSETLTGVLVSTVDGMAQKKSMTSAAPGSPDSCPVTAPAVAT